MTSTYAAPQGRLTLTSNTPVMAADATAQTSVYYTPYQGNIVPIYDGANMQSYTFSQLTMALNTSNQLSGKSYDLFVFLNSSIVTIAAGPAWSSATSRGTGTGTTELQQIDGLWVNANTITLKNGSTSYSSIPVGEATYVGSVYMTANGQTGVSFTPTAAAGGSSNGVIGLFNAYNRVQASCINQDSSIAWTYTSATWRAADASSTNSISWVDGLQQTSIKATYQCEAGTSTQGSGLQIGINLDSTTATPSLTTFSKAPTATLGFNYQQLVVRQSFPPQLGFHYIQAMESVSGGTGTFNSVGETQALILESEY